MKRWLVVLSLFVVVRPALADDGDPLYTCKAATGKISVAFKPDVELKDLVTWLMGFTCKNVIVGAGVDVGTKVTIVAPNAMTVKQAMKLFTDAVDAAGFVVQDKGDNLVIKLGPSSPKPCSGAPATASAAPDQPEDDPVVTAGIKKLDDTHYEVTAKVIDAFLDNPKTVGKSARIVPAMKDGKADGLKLYAIRPTSLYARVGLMNGDTIQAVNGYELTSADRALEAYTKLREAKVLELRLERRGKPLTLTITVK